jgi:dUTP pyrophosphatase
MIVKCKKLHESAIIPQYAKDGDAGIDLVATSFVTNTTYSVLYGTGLAVEIPEGYVGLIFPRSSITKKDLILNNSVGVIDSGYRGEIMVGFRKVAKSADHFNFVNIQMYELGDRIAQLIILPYPKIQLQEVEELSETERGDGGFGSTGK